MDKNRVIAEIKRVAAENAGKAPGRALFERRSAIKQSDWYPHLWLRWGDALVEAGFNPNQRTAPISHDVLFRKYAEFVRELGRLPVHGELRRRAKSDKSFPSHSTWQKLGGKEKLLKGLQQFCDAHVGYEQVAAMCSTELAAAHAPVDGGRTRVPTGFVYLMKSGRHYKIGKTISVGARERQLAIKIPIPPTTVHSIETDDPSGVEAYWHKRFDGKRGEGEWFDLTPEDVKAFKRWKRIA